MVTCELLHAHSAVRLLMVSERSNQLIRLLKNKAQTEIAGLEPIESFSEGLWNFITSLALCDYLLVPREAVEETLNAFA